MALPALASGSLPLGRWPATLAELEAAYVAGKSAKRQQIWQDWLDLTAALRDATGAVPAAWLSGSFLTNKPEPRDLDSVYLIEWPALRTMHADPQRAAFIQAVAGSQVKDMFGLSVDSFIIEWWPTAGPQRQPWASRYRDERGYWDDLWSRERSADLRQDALPRRGYVEVILDGYV